MKIKIILLIMILCLALPSSGHGLSQEALWEKVKQVMADKAFKAVMDLERLSENQNLNMSILVIHGGKHYHRMEYLEPASQRGKIIIHAKQKLWLYLPKLGRSIQVTPTQVIAKGGLGFDDLFLIARLNTFKPISLSRSPEMTYRLELVSKKENALLNRAILVIDPDTFIPVKQIYYTKNGEQARIITILSVVETEMGIKPENIRIENLITHEVTIIHLKAYQPLTEIDPAWFKPL